MKLSEYSALQSKEFLSRHVGPSESEVSKMLQALGFKTLDEFLNTVIPAEIKSSAECSLTDFPHPASERDASVRLRKIAVKNKIQRSYLGGGFNATITPTVIQRNILENPGWYTQYTPYQPEISQGRLEALLNFQTLISSLTGLPVSNSSLLDEGTAAAEAMSMSLEIARKNLGKSAPEKFRFFVSSGCHEQTIAVLKTRAKALGVEVVVGNEQGLLDEGALTAQGYGGVLLQYPNTFGVVQDYSKLCEKAHQSGVLVTVAIDILAAVLLPSPASFGADIAIGSSQRFGVPVGFGGPHAAFFATREEYARLIPGRVVGVSKDRLGKVAYRLALQTREQHIRREKATSNICTAQVLLAVIAGMYAVYHGPKGLKGIATRVATAAMVLGESLKQGGHSLLSNSFFDTLVVKCDSEKAAQHVLNAKKLGINLRAVSEGVLIALDETVSREDLSDLLQCFSVAKMVEGAEIDESKLRTDAILPDRVFNSYHSETEFLRYVRQLEARDLSLTRSMIPLGSCTMKLNASSEMYPISWPEFSSIHPLAPKSDTLGYAELQEGLERALAELCGFAGTSLQPNAGSQGEFAGLLAIRGYFEEKGELNRTICLIPRSAHGTNPASAVMAGMKVVAVNCDASGNIDKKHFRELLERYSDEVAACMITYPSTHGVFETGLKEICDAVHGVGGQVYLDGANLNALLGYVKPGELGVDVMHINLHKTFCIPHGGGGPGVGPISCAKHLVPFLPSEEYQEESESLVGPVASSALGSASILPISWMYIAMMGASGLQYATAIAILNANYLAHELKDTFPVVYRGESGHVAHECILDLRDVKKSAGVEVDDVAKRLMDYGFHAPTVSWPVPGTIMIEPTESEGLRELERFVTALRGIRSEISEIEAGRMPADNNPLKNAPHTAQMIASDSWDYPYSRTLAAFPSRESEESKFFPAVARIDNVYGDRNFICTCPTVDDVVGGEGDEGMLRAV